MKHLFLSYSRRDTDVMYRVRDALRSEGFAVWTDENLVPGTSQWNKEIQKAIMSAAGMVVLLSPDSNGSEWVANEIGYAKTCQVQIFPILVRGEERESVPIELIRVQRIDIRTRFLGKMQNLVDALQEHLEEVSEIEDQETETVSEPTVTIPDDPELSNREKERVKFWNSLVTRSKPLTKLFANVKPRERHWFSASAGKTGNKYIYRISKTWGSVEIYLDFDHQTGERNKKVFDQLYAQKDQIETEFGSTFEWLRLDDKRASRIIKYYHNGGLDTPESWSALQEQMIKGMIRLEQVFKARIQSIKI